MGQITANVRRRKIIITQPAITFAVALTEASLNEGALIHGPTVSCSLNGYSPTTGEVASVWLTTMTPADFAAAFPAETQATSAAGDFSGYTTAFIAACTALGINAVADTVYGIAAVRIDFVLDSGVLSVGINRQTTERSGDNGTRRLVHSLKNPTKGTLSTASDSVTILDTTGVPVTGDLTEIRVTPDWADAAHVDTGAVVATPGTVIGEILGFDSDGAAKVWASGGVTLVDALDGRFALAVISASPPRWNLVVGAGPSSVDFENLLNGTSHVPRDFYRPIIQGVSGAITISQQVKIRPRYGEINPTGKGSLTSPDFEPTSYATFDSAFGLSGDGKLVKISPSWIGVQKRTGSAQPKWRRSNSTLMGHVLFASKHCRGFIFQQGHNIIVYNFAFRVSADLALVTTTPAYKEVDNFNTAYGGSSWWRNAIFLNCSISASNDELARVKGNDGWFNRGVRFKLCNFFSPLYNGGHPKGASHNLGPAVSPGNAHIMFQLCPIFNCLNRMPRFNRSVGCTVWNSLIHGWQDIAGRGGIECIMGDVGAGGSHEQMTARIENTLFDTLDATRLYAIKIDNLRDPNTAWVYQAGNFHIDKATDNFGNAPLTLGDGVALTTGSVSGVLRATVPYELAGTYAPGLFPTSTEAERRALEDYMVGPVNGRSGVRELDDDLNVIPGDNALNAFDLDIIADYRAGTSDRGFTPTEADTQYATTWNGPGTKGHGMAVLI